ncbi:ribonuclease P protein component [Blattabacterium cuenoti]|uniref:ribonuclease P protein component n=1 Tax=Blattabacterium cuenoti TaxID=1653831 RepID=UPI00163BC399
MNWNCSKKKIFKKSVHRNRIKRLLRACFLLNKLLLEKKMKKKIFFFILIYNGGYLPKYQNINQSVKKIFNKIKRYYC